MSLNPLDAIITSTVDSFKPADTTADGPRVLDKQLFSEEPLQKVPKYVGVCQVRTSFQSGVIPLESKCW